MTGMLMTVGGEVFAVALSGQMRPIPEGQSQRGLAPDRSTPGTLGGIGHTDGGAAMTMTQQPRRGHYIVETLRFCGWMIFLGFFTALAVQLAYGVVRLMRIG